ncbi:MAG TPA: hypothetical protein VF322_09765 [Gammaproteobacteria bacterium]
MLGGCAQPEVTPLLFGQSHTVGITIGGNATEGGAELVIGYKDRDIAVVPVTMLQEDGTRAQLEAEVAKGFDADKQVIGADKDAFSVLGQFNVRARGATDTDAGLGKFFATGIAARRLADGFACSMGQGDKCVGDAPADANEQP